MTKIVELTFVHSLRADSTVIEILRDNWAFRTYDLAYMTRASQHRFYQISLMSEHKHDTIITSTCIEVIFWFNDYETKRDARNKAYSEQLAND